MNTNCHWPSRGVPGYRKHPTKLPNCFSGCRIIWQPRELRIRAPGAPQPRTLVRPGLPFSRPNRSVPIPHRHSHGRFPNGHWRWDSTRAHFLSVCLPWWRVYWDLLLVLKSELSAILQLNFKRGLFCWTQVPRHKCVTCRYFLPACVLFFHFLNSVFSRATVFNFDKVQFVSFYWLDHAFSVVSKNSA